MKILLCCPCPPIREFGIGKHVLELAESLRAEGCICDVVSPNQVKAAFPAFSDDYSRSLRAYLLIYAKNYDVVDYDHTHLPFPRSEFAAQTLFVARSFLLRHHLVYINIPKRRLWKSKLRRWLYAWWLDPYRDRLGMQDAQTTIDEADLVNVLNDDEFKTLVAGKTPASKIATIGLGLSKRHLDQFHQLPVEVSSHPTVVSIATFDCRKGAVEMPALLARIWQAVPDVHFRLLGGRRSPLMIYSVFPKAMRSKIEVIPEYNQESLPSLLASCTLGIFPSYIEGFPIGVLEMLAGALPVIAYRAPGAPMMLPDEWLVPRGDFRALADKAVHLLRSPGLLTIARQQARARSFDFSMKEVARKTMGIYLQHLANLRSKAL